MLLSQRISKIFSIYGKFIYYHPFYPIFGAFIIFVLACIGFTQININFESTEYMYTSGSIEYANKNLTKEVFGPDPYFVVVYLYSKGDSLISMDAYTEIVEVDTFLKNYTSKQGYQFSDYCNVLNSICYETPGPLYYWYNGSSGIQFDSSLSDSTLLDAVNSGSNTYTPTVKVDTESIFRNTTPTNLTKTVSYTFDLVSSNASQLLYILAPDKHDSEHQMEWENELRDEIKQMQKTYIEVDMYSANSTNWDINYYTVGDMKYIIFSIVCLILYSFLVLGKFDRVNSRVLLNLGGVLSIVISIVECFGFAQYTGIPVTTVHQLMCFLLIGVGYDDIFVIMNGFDRAQLEFPDDPDLQMARCFEHNGLSITVSSMTSFISFSTGLTMTIVLLRNFAVYAAIGIIMLWANTILIFGTFLSFHAANAHKQQADCCGLFTCLPPQTKGETYTETETEKETMDMDANNNPDKDNHSIRNKQETEENNNNVNNLSVAEKSRKESMIQMNGLQDHNDMRKDIKNDKHKHIKQKNVNTDMHHDQDVSFLNHVFKYHYNYLIKPPYMKVLNLVMMVVILYTSLLGATNVERLNEYLLYLPEEAYSYQVIEKQRNATANTMNVYFYTLDNEDYTSLLSQIQHTKMKELVQANEYYYSSFNSWYDRLYNFVLLGNCSVSSATVTMVEDLIPPSNFMDCLNQLIATDNSVQRYLTIESVSGSEDKILNSFFYFTTVEMSTDQKPKFLDQLYTIANQGPYHTYPYAHYFPIYSMEKVMVDNLLSMLISSFMAIMVIIYLIFNDLIATVLIACNVIQILLVVYSIIHWWGLYLNVMSVIFLAMAIGIAVDFCAHIMHEYIECSGSNELRAERALVKMGPAVTHAAISTGLGILFTVLGGGFVWRAFFRIWLMIIVSGVYYSLVIMPTILSMIGPASHADTDDQARFNQFMCNKFFRNNDKETLNKVYTDYDSVNDMISKYNMYNDLIFTEQIYLTQLVRKDLIDQVYCVRKGIDQSFGHSILEFLGEIIEKEEFYPHIENEIKQIKQGLDLEQNYTQKYNIKSESQNQNKLDVSIINLD